ncbi:ABC-type transport system, substrate-binding protein [Pseudobacteriovorax antillogorgiicola]|uniref:ABC-type transport system, substrate-binding protein n=1 Tax=Pseudobacteriovorax antillogorgiicola TaxID=1513793 RepID=A0A1Y6C5E4_9BACT|nr:ABC-type transport system substrate-binding protein [Pseudobacteriovorax antillogorgiicola]SMF37871.1 ABC-type transport system, substrate-binding protein [Pseudobacteriovorax antillogorgiicola]
MRCFRQIFFLFLLSSQAFSNGIQYCPTLHVDEMPSEFNSGKMVDLASHIMVNQVCERLVKKAADGAFTSEAALKWKFDKTGTSLVIWLRGDRLVRKNELVTAAHVKRMIETVLKAGVVHGFKKIIGSGEFLSNASNEVQGVEILSKFKVKLSFTEPYFSILDDLSGLHASLCVEDDLGIAGSGPYFIESIDKNIFRFRAKDRNIVGPKVFCISDKSQKGTFLSIGTPSSKNEFDASLSYFIPEIRFIGFNLDSIYGDIRRRRSVLKLFGQIEKDLKYDLGGFIPLGLAGHNPKLKLNTDGKSINPTNLEIDYYLKDFDEVASILCKQAKKVGVECKANRVSLKRFLQLNQENKLKLFMGRFLPSVQSTRDLVSVFKPDSQLNFFFKSDSSSEHQKQITRFLEPIYSANYRRMVDASKELDSYLVNNLIMAPIEYGVMKKIFFNSNYIRGELNINSPLDLEIEKLDVKDAYLLRH